jgi:Family of unknown function (DUF6338)
MPTTLTGLLLFVVTLLPGFAYVVGKERHGTERRLSTFRETVAIVIASVVSEITVLVIFSVIRTLWPSSTPNVGALLAQPSLYLFGNESHKAHYQNVAIWALASLIAATLIAYVATIPRLRRLAERLAGPYPHESAASSWWILFVQWKRTRQIEVICILDDGSSVRGRLGSFNISADDSPERDLVLIDPLYYIPPGEENEAAYDVSAVCISASRIVTMFVNYTAPVAVSPAPSSGGAADPQAASSAVAHQAQSLSRQPASGPSPRPATQPSARDLRQLLRSWRSAVPRGWAWVARRSPSQRRP